MADRSRRAALALGRKAQCRSLHSINMLIVCYVKMGLVPLSLYCEYFSISVRLYWQVSQADNEL